MIVSSPRWNERLLANPHALADKRERVRRMFGDIAGSYDLNNRIHSLWQDQRWRRRAVRIAEVRPGETVVDVACGTGDLTLAFSESAAGRVIGIDYTFPMLPLACRKRPSRGRPVPRFVCGDALCLPLPDGSADIVSIAFGIRNVADVSAAAREFRRVLRPGGRLIVLEFALPRHPALRCLYNAYFRRVLPLTATLISGDRNGAYRYLPESVNTFIEPPAMCELLLGAGFRAVRQQSLTFGVCICYRADV